MPKIKASTIAEHKEMSRTSLIDSAYALFNKRGFSGTSLTDVSSLAGVGRTTVYEYFPDKESLFLEVINTHVPGILAEALSSLTATDPAQRMDEVFTAGFNLAVEHRDISHVLFRVGRELPSEVRDTMWLALSPVTDEILSLCEQGVASGAFKGDAGLLAQAVGDLFVGGIDQVLGMPNVAKAAPGVLKQRLLFLKNGLG